MATQWNYYNPVHIYAGRNALAGLPTYVEDRAALLITTPGFSRRGLVDDLKTLLGGSLASVYDAVTPNPTFLSVKDAYEHARSAPEYGVIVAVGGGSVIDTAKVVAASTETGGVDWIADHLKQGKAIPPSFHPKPLIAVPTTSGTGSEVTMWATVWDMDEKRKYSLKHPMLYPKQAILDPDLTLSLPSNETLHSGLDAMSHAMEAIWNKRHNPVSDNYALTAIALIFEHLPLLVNDTANPYHRAKLQEASLLSGLAFSNTQTALAHSISYPLTIHYGLPHGLACSLTLPRIMKFNGSHHPDRVKIMADAFNADADIDEMETRLETWLEGLSVSTKLSKYNIPARATETIAGTALSSGRAGNNIADIDQQGLVRLVNTLY